MERERIETGSTPTGWPINNEILIDLGRKLDRGEALDPDEQAWLVQAANDLSNALDDERDSND